MMNLPEKVFARIVGAMVILALIGGLLALQQCASARSAKTRATLDHNQGTAAIQSGRDAVDVVGTRGQRETAIDAITKENDHDIRKALGANTAVNPAVRDAGLAGLCKRAAYSRDAKCVRFTPPR